MVSDSKGRSGKKLKIKSLFRTEIVGVIARNKKRKPLRTLLDFNFWKTSIDPSQGPSGGYKSDESKREAKKFRMSGPNEPC